MGLRRYAVSRLLQTIPIVIGVITTVFVLMHSFPGDPIDILLGPQAPTSTVERTRELYGLDEPVYIQYINYVVNVFQGELGVSISYRGTSVASLIANRLPVTLFLTAAAFAFAIPISIFLGVISAQRRNKPVDHVSRMIALVGVSTPSFWIGLLLIIVFSYHLNWLPPTRLVLPWAAPATVESAATRLDVVVTSARHLLMPMLALGTLRMAAITRVERSSMLEELGEEYITLARAYGVKERTILRKHAFRNAQLPVITIIGLDMGMALGGSVLTETVFEINGMGRLIIEAIKAQDYPLVMGTTLVFSLIFIVTVVLTDIAYAYIDPRVSYDSGE